MHRNSTCSLLNAVFVGHYFTFFIGWGDNKSEGVYLASFHTTKERKIRICGSPDSSESMHVGTPSLEQQIQISPPSLNASIATTIDTEVEEQEWQDQMPRPSGMSASLATPMDVETASLEHQDYSPEPRAMETSSTKSSDVKNQPLPRQLRENIVVASKPSSGYETSVEPPIIFNNDGKDDFEPLLDFESPHRRLSLSMPQRMPTISEVNEEENDDDDQEENVIPKKVVTKNDCNIL